MLNVKSIRRRVSTSLTDTSASLDTICTRRAPSGCASITPWRILTFRHIGQGLSARWLCFWHAMWHIVMFHCSGAVVSSLSPRSNKGTTATRTRCSAHIQLKSIIDGSMKSIGIVIATPAGSPALSTFLLLLLILLLPRRCTSTSTTAGLLASVTSSSGSSTFCVRVLFNDTRACFIASTGLSENGGIRQV